MELPDESADDSASDRKGSTSTDKMSYPLDEDFYDDIAYEEDDVYVEEDEEAEELTASGSSSHAGHDSGYEPSPPGNNNDRTGDRFTFSRTSTPSTSEAASGVMPFGSPSSSSVARVASSTRSTFPLDIAVTPRTPFASPFGSPLGFASGQQDRWVVSPYAIYRAFRDRTFSEPRRSVQSVATQTSPRVQVWSHESGPTDSEAEEEDTFWPSPPVHPLPDLLLPAVLCRTGPCGHGRGRSRSLPASATSHQEIGQTLRLLSDQFEMRRTTNAQVARRRRSKSES